MKAHMAAFTERSLQRQQAVYLPGALTERIDAGWAAIYAFISSGNSLEIVILG
jgi:hypothetical protein